LAVCAFALVAVPASACTVSSAHVQGRFDDAGQFVVTGMLDAHGQPISADGFVCKTLTTEDGVALEAQDGTIYVVGDVDPEAHSLHVRHYTKDAAVAAAAVAHAKAGVQVASAGAGCASKAASASCTVAKGAAAKAAGADGCCAKGAAAKAASAGSSCSGAKGAAAKAASAGSSCSGAKGAAKAASAGSSCSGAKGAAVETAQAPTGNQVVFAVSGMTCGGCEAKVEAAVAAMKLDGVTGCKVSHQDGQAVLTLADGAEIDVDEVAKAISATGFHADLPKGADEKAATEEPTSTM
jgi:copper chaperone CopZ